MPAARALNSSMLQLLDIMDEAAALFDLDGTVIMVNEAGATRMGLTRDALIGRCIYDLLPADVSDFRRRLLDGVVTSGEPLHFADLSDAAVRVGATTRPVLPGMSGVAAVVVGRRTLASYAFEPLRQMREALADAPPAEPQR